MLYTLTQEKLAGYSFHSDDYTKEQARNLAREIGMHVADKLSSQEICFAASNYGSLLNHHMTTLPGEIINKDGEILDKLWYSIRVMR